MNSGLQARPRLFGGSAFELLEADVPQLQAFLEANPAYFLAVGGKPPGPDEAMQEFRDLPPAHMTYTGRWIIGFSDGEGRMIGMASVLSDFLAPGVWHVGLFIVATALHGTGTAAALCQAMEDWMKANGAEWVRLGVVRGNARAEAFWDKRGYLEMRRREGVTLGDSEHTIRVLAKPLAGGSADAYLRLVPRDQPGSTLP